jgi:hypothetical protein
MSSNPDQPQRSLVWSGKPTVTPVLMVWGIISIVVLLVLVSLEWFAGNSGNPAFPPSVAAGGLVLPYPLK